MPPGTDFVSLGSAHPFPQELAVRNHPHVLFICTGNYYRSRFAEAVFNHHARRQAIPWRAFSRGLSLFLPQGALSPHVIVGLTRRGIALTNTTMDPTPLTEANLRRAAIRIALFESEHRPMVARLFPEWETKTTYWRIPDLDEVTPDEGLAMIEAEVVRLIEELQGRPEAVCPDTATAPRSTR